VIVLDTNVISELMRPAPDRKVLNWAFATDLGSLWTTAVSEAEILAGIALKNDGKRRRELETAATALFGTKFAGRVLPFDSGAAKCFAAVVRTRSRLGRPIKVPDAMIAAICIAREATIVTRDTGGFDNLGLAVINPWTD
jgi:predicted nucleic acid-binding protein